MQSAHLATFEHQGFALAEGFYSADQVARMRGLLDAWRARGRNPTLAEAPELLDILFNERLHALAGALLDAPPVIFADIQINALDFWSRYGWHKDSIDRHDANGPDWRVSPYPILRFGTYFQDYREHSGAVAMQPGSHRGVRPDLPGRRLAMRPGDLGGWYLTTNHSANAPSLRGFGDWVPVPPANRVLNRLGYLAVQALDRRPFVRPRHPLRQVVFFAIGAAGEPLARYLSYLLHRRYFHAATATLPMDDPLRFLSQRSFRVLNLAPLRAAVDPRELFDDYDQRRAAVAAERLKPQIMAALGLGAPTAGDGRGPPVQSNPASTR